MSPRASGTWPLAVCLPGTVTTSPVPGRADAGGRPGVFPASTPEEFHGLMKAQNSGPVATERYLGEHPHIAAALDAIAALGDPPLAWGRTAFNSMNAYRLVNAEGVGRFVRFRFEPEEGVASLPPEQWGTADNDYLMTGVLAQVPVPPPARAARPRRRPDRRPERGLAGRPRVGRPRRRRGHRPGPRARAPRRRPGQRPDPGDRRRRTLRRPDPALPRLRLRRVGAAAHRRLRARSRDTPESGPPLARDPPVP